MIARPKIKNQKSKIFAAALLLLALIPLLTLVYKNDVMQWSLNRSLMVAPDEFSYLLTAQNVLHGQGISTQSTLGLDTFYPPGFPLLLAGWFSLAGRGAVTPFAAHLLNALLLSAATIVVYFFSRRLLALLAEHEHPRFRWGENANSFLALLVAGIFAANWHVLETALFVLAEPAFMLVTFAWLALALKWKNWHLHPLQTLAVTLLAIAAWSLRGAGLVCIAVTLLYPCITLFQSKIENGAGRKSKIVCILLIGALALAYQLALYAASPEKSLFSTAASTNSYTRQLVNGITSRGELKLSRPDDWPKLIEHVSLLALSHLDDFAQSFTPWLRDSPDLLPRYLVGKILALLALAGFLRHLLQKSKIENRKSKIVFRVLDLYLLAYFVLYLLWPFNMLRFWSPILPIMLIFAVDALRHFSLPRSIFTAYRTASILMALLLILTLQELYLHLGDYQRRINYVSGALALSAAAVVHASPNPANTIVAVAGDDERFVFAWYFSRTPGGSGFLPRSPEPHLGGPGGAGERETLDALLLGCLDELHRDRAKRMFAIRYFNEPDYPAVLQHLEKITVHHANVQSRLLFRRGDAVRVWEITPSSSH
jgi:hypothetical protein